MTKKNKYFNRSHQSQRKFKEIIRLFSFDQSNSLCGKNKQKYNQSYSQKVKTKNNRAFAKKKVKLQKGEIEIDESYFGARRVRGKKGKGDLQKND